MPKKKSGKSTSITKRAVKSKPRTKAKKRKKPEVSGEQKSLRSANKKTFTERKREAEQLGLKEEEVAEVLDDVVSGNTDHPQHEDNFPVDEDDEDPGLF